MRRVPAAWFPGPPDDSLRIRAAGDRSAARAGTPPADPQPALRRRSCTMQTGSAIASWVIQSPLLGYIVLYITISPKESKLPLGSILGDPRVQVSRPGQNSADQVVHRDKTAVGEEMRHLEAAAAGSTDHHG